MKKLICSLVLLATTSVWAQETKPAAVGGVASYYKLEELSTALSATAIGVYTHKANFLKGVAKAVDSLPDVQGIRIEDSGVAPRLFVLNALDPLFRDIQSKWFESKVLTSYQLARAKQNHRYRVTSLGDVPQTSDVVTIALKMAKEGWKSLRPYLTSERDREVCDATVESIGRALANRNHRTVDPEAGAALLESLSTQARTRGLAITTRSVMLSLAKPEIR